MYRDSAEPSDIALAHWGEHVNGGGDRVAWELARTFEDAPLYVGWRDASIEPPDIETEQLLTGRLTERALRRGGLARMAAHLLGWQVADPLREYDALLTSGNEPLFYVPPTDQAWVAYIHHTNRRQSDQIDEVGSGPFTPVTLLLYYCIRVAFDHNTHKPDLFVANSEPVKRRMVRYWGVPAEKIEVVYPPVETAAYSPAAAETESYYLTLSRLDWHKDVDGIVSAFDGLDARLVVAGDGPDRDELERQAGDNVEFRGYVSEDEKRELLAGAKAFVFNARDEDFGISPVEALASGTPLLGIREGMTRYQVIDGKNGYTHVRDGTEGRSIADSVRRFEAAGVEWTDSEIESFAERFSAEAFREGIHDAVSKAAEAAATTPGWYDEIAETTEPDA